MGVHGLWQILESCAHPVDVSNLKGKVLAVDVSIWLHQLVKGFKDKDGNPLPNAHLLGVFYRVCKLLSYGIKPVFVFDGGVPVLKRQTLMARRKNKLEAMDKSEISRQKLLSNYIRQQLQRETRQVIQLPETITSNSASTSSPTKTSPTKRVRDREEIDLELQQFREKFLLNTEMDVDKNKPSTSSFNNKNKDDDHKSSSEEEEDESSGRYGMDYYENYSTITSKDFDELPLELRHEILYEMTESRKMNNWKKMETMPSNLQDFSSYQMDRLVKRRFLQKKIQSVQSEMGQRHIHVQNLDELLKMDYNFDHDDVVGSQEKGFVLIKKSPHEKNNRAASEMTNDSSQNKNDIHQSNKRQKLNFDTNDESELRHDISSDSENECDSSAAEDVKVNIGYSKSIPDLEEEQQLALAIQLSLLERTDPTTTTCDNPVVCTKDDIKIIPAKISDSTTTSFVLPSTSASCSKFLDVVGFSSRAVSYSSSSSSLIVSDSAAPSKIANEGDSSSSSDEDFETVQDESTESSTLNKEQDMVKDLLKNVDTKESQENGTITTINIVDVVSKIPTEDIFADIFCNQQQKSENREPIATIQVHDEEEEINWDSDPDVESIEKLESSASSKQEQLADQHSLNTGNQKINRTLGRFPQQSTASSSSVTMITTEYMQAQERLKSEQSKLSYAKGFQERVATSITDQISGETQELLSLFKIPFIVSPMEAESQCAFLDRACLTDGTITDDSDCWLFGSLRVYKNFYSSGNKHIEFYQLADITKNLNLDREKLIMIAMLSGGDYSDGIDGVGPVTALEILAEFDTLIQFREWWDLVNEHGTVIPDDLSKTRKKLQKLKLRPGFPNEAVYQAYVNPTIDTSTEAFKWGNPDIDALRAYMNKKFGWDEAKCDSMLLPVMKNLSCQIDKSKQPTLDSFLVSTRYDVLNKRKRGGGGSRRLQTAFKKLKQSAPVAELNLSSEESSSEDEPQPQRISSKPKTKSVKTKNKEDSEDEQLDSVDQVNAKFPEKNTNIPQKVQSETNKSLAKQKAIEIFKNKK